MNKKEVLDAMSQEFRKSLQDIDATNGDVIKAMFPYLKVERVEEYYIVVYLSGNSYYHRYNLKWWNAKYKGVSE